MQETQQLGDSLPVNGTKKILNPRPQNIQEKQNNSNKLMAYDIPSPSLENFDLDKLRNKLNNSMQVRGELNTPSTRGSSKRYKVRVNRNPNVPDDFFFCDNIMVSTKKNNLVGENEAEKNSMVKMGPMFMGKPFYSSADKGSHSKPQQGETSNNNLSINMRVLDSREKNDISVLEETPRFNQFNQKQSDSHRDKFRQKFNSIMEGFNIQQQQNSDSKKPLSGNSHQRAIACRAFRSSSQQNPSKNYNLSNYSNLQHLGLFNNNNQCIILQRRSETKDNPNHNNSAQHTKSTCQNPAQPSSIQVQPNSKNDPIIWKRPLSVKNIRNKISQQFSSPIAHPLQQQQPKQQFQQPTSQQSQQPTSQQSQHVEAQFRDFTFKSSDFQNVKKPKPDPLINPNLDNKENLQITVNNLLPNNNTHVPSHLLMRKSNNYLKPKNVLQDSKKQNFLSTGTNQSLNKTQQQQSLKQSLVSQLPPISSRKNSDSQKRYNDSLLFNNPNTEVSTENPFSSIDSEKSRWKSQTQKTNLSKKNHIIVNDQQLNEFL